jgi:hypothetical protein
LKARIQAGKGIVGLACAMAAGCDFFLTTDDFVVKRRRRYAGIAVMDPTQFIVEVQ